MSETLAVDTFLPGTALTFSGASVDELTASEYTLVNLEVDHSSSTLVGAIDKSGSPVLDANGKQVNVIDQIKKAIGIAFESCQKDPRRENMLCRVELFNHTVEEKFGFLPLDVIQRQDFSSITATGSTDLYGAASKGLSAVLEYGKKLRDSFFSVNGIVFILTDGEDTVGSTQPSTIKAKLDQIHAHEALESLRVIVIGFNNNNSGFRRSMESFLTSTGIDQFELFEDMTDTGIAKLAGFISKSISSASQSLGSGGPSQLINPNQIGF